MEKIKVIILILLFLLVLFIGFFFRNKPPKGKPEEIQENPNELQIKLPVIP